MKVKEGIAQAVGGTFAIGGQISVFWRGVGTSYIRNSNSEILIPPWMGAPGIHVVS